jgi:hypothetical protein
MFRYGIGKWYSSELSCLNKEGTNTPQRIAADTVLALQRQVQFRLTCLFDMECAKERCIPLPNKRCQESLSISQYQIPQRICRALLRVDHAKEAQRCHGMCARGSAKEGR